MFQRCGLLRGSTFYLFKLHRTGHGCTAPLVAVLTCQNFCTDCPFTGAACFNWSCGVTNDPGGGKHAIKSYPLPGGYTVRWDTPKGRQNGVSLKYFIPPIHDYIPCEIRKFWAISKPHSILLYSTIWNRGDQVRSLDKKNQRWESCNTLPIKRVLKR